MTTYSSWGKDEGGGIFEVMIPVIVIITGMTSKVAITTIKSGSRKKKNVMLRFFFRFFPPVPGKKEVG